MKFNTEGLRELVQELALADDIKASDIPNIDLYMEQLTSFIDTNLSDIKRNPDDKILTKTMINNYTKAGLLMPPNKKKYNKDHIILLILIYHLKNTLSINDIKIVLSPILNNIATRDDDVISLGDIYSTFLELKNSELDELYGSFIERSRLIKKKTEEIEKDNQEVAELFLLVLMLVAQANAQKRLAEKIIDNYFKHEEKPGN